MSVIALPKFTQQAAQQTVKQGASQDKSLTSPMAQAARTALNNAQQKSATPSPVKESGGGAMTQGTPAVGSGNSNVMTQAADGMMGIRSGLVGRGISDDRIGWNGNTKSVTVDGKDVYSPSTIIDGTSYASEQDLNRITNDAYRNSGQPLVGVTRYVSSTGLENATTWSDGQLLIGGQQVPVAYVDAGGKAYARQSDVDKAMENYRKRSGITGNQGVYDSWQSKYGSKINSALDDVLNRKEWSYDMENDPAYQAYKEAYLREGNRAFQNAYAQAAANTGGYGSSVASAAAGQQLNYYQQQLNDRIPELMQNDYTRYLGEQQLRRQALDSLLTTADNDYNKIYTANRDAINDTNEANRRDYERDIDARNYNRDVEVTDRQWPYQEALLQEQIKQGGLATEAQQISNQMSKLQYILSKYQYSGSENTQISAEDAAGLGISAKEDGTYPTIGEIQNAYARMQAAANLIQWNNYGKQEAIDTYNIGKGLGV